MSPASVSVFLPSHGKGRYGTRGACAILFLLQPPSGPCANLWWITWFSILPWAHVVGEGSGVAKSCSVGCRCGSDLALLGLWHRTAAADLI